MRRWAIVGVSVLVFAGLVAANLLSREDDQPDLGDGDLPARVRNAPEAAVVEEPEPQPSREPPEEPAEEAEEAQEEAEPGGEQAPAEEAEEDEPAEEAAALPVADDDCDHPYVPSAVGALRRYRWVQAGQERAAELRLEVREVRVDGREREVRWAMSVIAEGAEAPLAAVERTTRCRPRQTAEEPWFGVLELGLGLSLVEDERRWRWPAELGPGIRFEGTATFDPSASAMQVPEGASRRDRLFVERQHVVERREEVTVPAGTFDAWRIDYEESHRFGPRGETGTGRLWVASEVGLVRSEAMNEAGVSQVIELVQSVGPGFPASQDAP